MKPFTDAELLKFIAVISQMGMDKRASITDYWSKEYLPAYTKWYSSMFSNRDRFLTMIQTVLHAGDVDALGKAKIEPFIKQVILNFNSAFVPFEQVSIDEMVIGFKGRFKYKQFNSQKPDKYHIKAFGLCDSRTGYVNNLLIYFGSETSYKPQTTDTDGHATKIFNTLLEPLGTGYHIYFDRWYTTRKLIDWLHSKCYNFTCTINANRVGFPQEFKECTNMPHKSVKYWATEESKYLSLAFRDKKAKKPVLMATSAGATGTSFTKSGKEKPSIVVDYNNYMNGCDRADQLLGYYGFQKRRTHKWWKKIFFWFMEVIFQNAFVLYKLSRERPLTRQETHRLTFRNFKRAVVVQLEKQAVKLEQEAGVVQPKRGRPFKDSEADKHAPGKHLIMYTDEDRRCKVCSLPEDRKRTNFICDTCPSKPHLHPKDCFKIYHTT